MKKTIRKIFAVAMVVALVAAFSVAFAACNDDGNTKAIRIVYYADGAAVQAALSAGQIDYGIVG